MKSSELVNGIMYKRKITKEKLAGMFAFTMWSENTQTLYLVRDRLGKKPLFYAVLGGALHFASEIKCFRHSPAWDPSIDESTLEIVRKYKVPGGPDCMDVSPDGRELWVTRLPISAHSVPT